MQLKRGAVVTASIGGPSGKPRPFLVLRSSHFTEHSLVTIMAFTGTLEEAQLLRVTVQPSAENGLHLPSQAMSTISSRFACNASTRLSDSLPTVTLERSLAPSRSTSESRIRRPVRGRSELTICEKKPATGCDR